jgi:heptosyltransferase I
MKQKINLDTSPSYLVMAFGAGGVGDHLTCSAFVRNLAQNHPDATIDFAAFSKIGAELFRYNPYIRHIHILDMSYLKLGGKYRFPEKIRYLADYRKLKYDAVYVLGTKLRHALFAFFTGARKRVGYRSYNRDFLLTKKGNEPVEKNVTERYLDLLLLDGMKIFSSTNELFLSEKENTTVDRIFHECGIADGDVIITMAPFAAQMWRTWGLAHFWEAAERLIRVMPNCKILILGSDSDRVHLDTVPHPRHPSIINFLGRLTILETAAAIKKSSAFLGNDSGLGHIAGSVGTKSLILGYYITRVWYPMGPRVRTIIKDIGCTSCNLCAQTGDQYLQCFSSITVEEVVNTLTDMLIQDV